MSASPPDPLVAYAQAQPDKPAVIEDRPDGRRTIWTYAALNRQANRLANLLLALGVQPGDKVVWCARNSPGVVRMVHAARKIGATAVPLNYRLTPAEAAYIVEDCDAALVYTDAESMELFVGIRSAAPRVRHVLTFEGPPAADMLDAETALAAASDAEPAMAAGEQAATMIYTSGTTGRPKGAYRTGLGNPEQIQQLVAAIGYRPDDVYLTTGPLYHSGPGGFLRIAHLLGNTVVVQRRFDPEDWLRLVEAYRVTTTFSAPTPIRLVCNLPGPVKARYDRSSMRRLIANAAPWSFALKEAYLADFPEDSLWEVYGSTELGVNTVLAPTDQRRKPGSCGRAAPGVTIKLFDDEGREVTAPYVPGALHIRSPSVFEGYYKDRETYEAARRGDFFTVGDIAYRDDEDYYFICDRKSDMIISGGVNVYPAEVEAALERHPGILDVAVFGVPDDHWGEAVHAVVVRRDAALSADTVADFAREHLAGYKVPRSVEFVEEIPRTGSGKILKRLLREPHWAGRDRRVS
ncbi:MAG: AMP-binding protein [Candidatus Rokuibacteriota bacterium]